MSLFSSRKGLIQPAPKTKPGELSEILRKALWNDFYKIYKSKFTTYGIEDRLERPMAELLRHVWSEYLGNAADDYPGHDKMIKEIRRLFSSAEWFVPFDLLELLWVNADHLGIVRQGLEHHINGRLDVTNAAYSFVNGQFVDRMTEEEKDSVGQAMSSPLDPVREHMSEAKRLLAERRNPSLANCVKEAISAVEAQARASLNDDSLTLNKAIDKLDAKLELHPPIQNSRQGFVRLDQ
jgi:hypothetical protein